MILVAGSVLLHSYLEYSALLVFGYFIFFYLNKPNLATLVYPITGASFFTNIGVTYLGIVSYFMLKRRWLNRSAILVSSVITIICCCTLYIFSLEVYTFSFYTGVFVGMTTTSVFCNYRKVLASFIAGGLLFIMEVWAPKIGGMLGFVAFMSILLMFFVESAYKRIYIR